MFRFFFLYLSTIFFFCHSYSEELNKSGFFTNGAGLYWRANEAGLSYATQSSSSEKLATHTEVKNPKFEWDFGFKLGVGFRFPHDSWQLQLQFTAFQTHTDHLKKVEEGRFFFPRWQKSTVGGPFFAEEVKVHWRLHLGLADLMLSKIYRVTKSLFLTPQIGIRGGSIRKKYYLTYSGGSFPKDGDEIVHMKNKYFGIGPNMGLLGQWIIGKGFSLFAKGLLSLLYGEFYLHQNEYAAKERILGLYDIFPASTCALDACAGIRWQACFQGALKRIGWELAWDQLHFFSQNQLLHFPNAYSQGVFFATQGDLAVSGIEFNIRFDF